MTKALAEKDDACHKQNNQRRGAHVRRARTQCNESRQLKEHHDDGDLKESDC